MLTKYSLHQASTPIKRALISVFDKTGLEPFARSLQEYGVEIISTGGTARHLRKAGINVTDVQSLTQFPEIMDGRVKTLHPLVEGGILGLRDRHAKEAEDNGILWIDLVVCNLYPFGKVISRPETQLAEALENIDIGGPTMIRSAAKNVGWVTVVVDPADYETVSQALVDSGTIDYDLRRRLSAKAFRHTAAYDALISNYLTEEPFSEKRVLPLERTLPLRYGENPHQKAAVYQESGSTALSILGATIHQGKQLSYNNIMDADGALACLREYDSPACVVVKHANPCGVAVGDDLLDVYTRAFNADSLSAFGGIIALNRTCTAEVAEAIRKVFVEIVLAPDFEPEALTILARKKNLRVLSVGPVSSPEPGLEYRNISGGFLIQDRNTQVLAPDDLNCVTQVKPHDNDLDTMRFAWTVLKHVKSNGILLAKDFTTVGIGPGQVSRVDAVEIALRKAGGRTPGAILASDAFFPFRDSIDKLAGTGIRGVIQPGGSIRDQEVIDACNEQGLFMVFTGTRCFKH
ncbi:MAG: bifunctional phosphoribosylaminoimidazolecarboxamide formyltransferase/IMP cyclohydrolase [FCB group bacterium]|nr:bifunctional phosphoribosylaminoimidazolecarboxamide formyltransferase/IMP cyclohydrolase [FCB group bacterium]